MVLMNLETQHLAYTLAKRTAVVGVIHLNVLILVKTPIKPSTNSLFLEPDLNLYLLFFTWFWRSYFGFGAVLFAF
jgi:hypothetical protein